MISIIGFPTDKNSSFLRGAALAPSEILNAFHSNATNKFSESGTDVGKNDICFDLGCINLEDQENEFQIIQEEIKKELKKNNLCISIGGDHSITFPILKAYQNFYSRIAILHFDAHPDLYENFDNNNYSHASPFARIMENRLATSLTQIGIRTLNKHQEQQANLYNVNIIKMKDFDPNFKFRSNDPVYISIDLDGLDPAFAPGVSHPEPGGFSTRDLLQIISNIKGKIIGADIVEYNPKKDLNNITAITAAKILKELVSKLSD